MGGVIPVAARKSGLFNIFVIRIHMSLQRIGR